MTDAPTRAPRSLVALGALALTLPALAVVGLAAEAPWSSMWDQLSDPDVVDALGLTLLTSLVTTAVAVTLGVPLAYVLARVPFPGRRLARAMVTLPMVLPPVAGGVALLLALGRDGLVGGLLDDWFDVQLAFTTTAAVLAQLLVAMPFVVLTVEAAIRGLDRRYEEAARLSGSGPVATFWEVTVPLVRPAIGAGALLCWARAVGELGATLTFAGSVPGRTRTLPLEVLLAFDTNPAAAVAISVLLLVVSGAVLIALRDRWLVGPRR